MLLSLSVFVLGDIVLPKIIIIGDELFEVNYNWNTFRTKKLSTSIEILKEIGSKNIMQFSLIGNQE